MMDAMIYVQECKEIKAKKNCRRCCREVVSAWVIFLVQRRILVAIDLVGKMCNGNLLIIKLSLSSVNLK